MQVPVPMWPYGQPPLTPASTTLLSINTTTVAGGNFAFQIKRQSNGRILWDTSIGGFVYSDQFLQISTLLPSQNVYGFGENTHQTFKHDFKK